MGRMPWAMFLWPGLPQLWRRGTAASLAVAVGFALLLNMALMATLVWSELFQPEVRNGVCIAVALFWGSSVFLSRRWDRRPSAPPDAGASEDAYTEALDHYLKGNWVESEHLICQLLRRAPRDLDAGLMLATLLRHTGRFDEAQRQLDRIIRFEGAHKWALEIRREREFLDEARKARASRSEPAADAASGIASVA